MGFNQGGTTTPEKADMGTMKPSSEPLSMMQVEATVGAPAGKMAAGISILVTEAETLARAEMDLGRNISTGTKK